MALPPSAMSPLSLSASQVLILHSSGEISFNRTTPPDHADLLSSRAALSYLSSVDYFSSVSSVAPSFPCFSSGGLHIVSRAMAEYEATIILAIESEEPQNKFARQCLEGLEDLLRFYVGPQEAAAAEPKTEEIKGAKVRDAMRAIGSTVGAYVDCVLRDCDLSCLFGLSVNFVDLPAATRAALSDFTIAFKQRHSEAVGGVALAIANNADSQGGLYFSSINARLINKVLFHLRASRPAIAPEFTLLPVFFNGQARTIAVKHANGFDAIFLSSSHPSSPSPSALIDAASLFDDELAALRLSLPDEPTPIAIRHFAASGAADIAALFYVHQPSLVCLAPQWRPGSSGDSSVAAAFHALVRSAMAFPANSQGRFELVNSSYCFSYDLRGSSRLFVLFGGSGARRLAAAAIESLEKEIRENINKIIQQIE